MSSEIKTVILVGAGGDLGTPILNALLASSFKVSVLTRTSSKSTFPQNVTVHRSDYSGESLESIFKGQDAVVSAVGSTVINEQTKLIDAAIAAGVKRFLPSEFGSNTTDLEFCSLFSFFKPKIEIIDYLKENEKKGLTWTAIVTGPFFDWGLKNGLFGFDHAKQTALLIDDGVRPIVSTTLPMIGRAVVEVLLRPEQTVNKHVFVASFSLSQREILAVIEKVSGKKYEITHATAEEKRKAGAERMKNGDMYGYIDGLLGTVIASLDKKEPLDNKMLGLPEENVEEVVKKVLAVE